MRSKVIDSIFDLMSVREDLFFITADMGINLVEKFQISYPNRYLNVGIAEQNMIGVAAGLSNIGFRPFVYTISNFAVQRCIEHIRNDISIHNKPITIIGTSVGYDNAPLGPTHHIIDDWGMLKHMPNLDIYCPHSNEYADLLVSNILARDRPAYIRIPKVASQYSSSSEDWLHSHSDGSSILLISYGALVDECYKAQSFDPSISILALNKLNNFDNECLASVFADYKLLIVVEDHFASSGLFSTISSIVSGSRTYRPRVISISPCEYNMTVGQSAAYFHRLFGLDAKGILDYIAKIEM